MNQQYISYFVEAWHDVSVTVQSGVDIFAYSILDLSFQTLTPWTADLNFQSMVRARISWKLSENKQNT